jgi:twinkle protein
MAGFEGFEIADDDIDFTKYAMQPDDKTRFLRPRDVEQEIRDLSYGKLARSGLTLPWSRWHNNVRFPRGQVTIWGGFTHHGKTHMLKQLMCWAIKHNEPVAIASFEERPGVTLFHLCRIATQSRQPNEEEIDLFCHWARNNLWIYNQKRIVTPERIIGVMNYAARELGCYHFVIDSLMRLDIDLEDQERVKMFANALGLHAEQSNIHCHLVAHVMKGDQTKLPDLYAIKGPGYLCDQADRVILVWRNKVPKHERNPDKHYRTDAILNVDKQRGDPDWIGPIGLDYHHESTQLVLAGDLLQPVQYIPGIGATNAETMEMFGT